MTTIRFLPDVDLAIIAPLPTEQKRKALEGFRLSRPPYTYGHFRGMLPGLLRLATPMFGAPPEMPFEWWANAIRRVAKTQAEADANIRVAAGVYASRWRGREQHFPAMRTSIGHQLVYWAPAVLNINDRPVIPFFNPRKKAMPAHAFRFVYSLMHEQIRVADPDFAEAALCINHFSSPKEGPRVLNTVYDDGISLFGFDELQRMVAETYDIWAEVLAGRVADARRRGGEPF